MVRYAVYYMPRPGGLLWAFGSAAIGYDALSATEPPPLPHPFLAGEAWRDWTAVPRRYGFHGTLKAPFELADGTSEMDLVAAVARFASALTPFPAGLIEIAAHRDFLALEPHAACPALDDLAGACVTAFEPFRAPLRPADRERRLRDPLTPRQREHLERWGYPHVFEDFRFHFTLTGAVPAEEREAIRDALAEAYRPLAAAPLVVDAVALFRQPSRDQKFTVLRRFPFVGA